MKIKTKINTWNIRKHKSFWTAMESINKKTTLRMGENICCQGETNKRIISKIHEQLMQLNIKKKSQPNQKWAEDLNRHFSNDDM